MQAGQLRMTATREGNHGYSLGDDGCEVSATCLECPLVACRYDYEGDRGLSLRPALEATFEAGIINGHLVEVWNRQRNTTWSSLSPDARQAIGLRLPPLEGETPRRHAVRLYRFGLTLNETSKVAGISLWYTKQYTEGVKRAEQWAA